jgi:hypothetical protein
MLRRATDCLPTYGLPNLQVCEPDESWIETALNPRVWKPLAWMRNGIALGPRRNEAGLVKRKDLSREQVILLPLDGIYECCELVISGCNLVDGALQHFEELDASVGSPEKPRAKPIEEDRCHVALKDEAPRSKAGRKLAGIYVLNKKVTPRQLDGLHFDRSGNLLRLVTGNVEVQGTRNEQIQNSCDAGDRDAGDVANGGGLARANQLGVEARANAAQ